MSDRRIDLGPTGETVRQNVTRLREDQNLTFAELSRRLKAAGNPIPPLGLRRIEAGERRVHVDDLVALAVVLRTSPTDLITPGDATKSDTAEIQATGIPSLPARHFRMWTRSGNEMYLDPDFDFEKYNRERKRRLTEELGIEVTERVDQHYSDASQLIEGRFIGND